MSTTQRVGSAGSTHSSPDFFELLSRQGVLDPEEAGLRRRLVMSFLAFGLLLAGHVWVSMQSRNLGYEGEALGRLIHRLDQERVELEDDLARESRPASLASRAVELGMQKPGKGQLRRLGAGTVAASAPFAANAASPAAVAASTGMSAISTGAGATSRSAGVTAHSAGATSADAKP